MVTMVEQRFDPELDQEPVLKRLVETASLYLEDETRETASPAVATWQRNSGRGTDPVSLQILDSTLGVEASRTFSRAELENVDQLETNIIRFWGKVLERRSSARIEKLMESLRNDNGEGDDIR